ncbi:MAG: tail fiber domain-containing protein [Candidatus Margulisbacteria bacterium]|nr:tail fiber domain-containing protein [Candidatus Margulisiibacteriota bacterium]
MKKKLQVLMFWLVAIVMMTSPVLGAVPMRINFQGKLNDEAMKAANFDKGLTVKCTFKIGSAYQGSCTLTTDEAKAKTDGITFVDSFGVFSVSIGGGGEVKDEIGTLAAVDWTQDNLLLNISFTPAIVPAGDQPLNSTPYALTALNVHGGSGYFAGNVGIGMTSATSKLAVAGLVEMTGFKMPTGRSSGYVLTCDANGNGNWAAATGGSGLTNPMTTNGDLIVGGTSGAPARLADIATGNALLSGGVGAQPSWGKIGLTTHVSGTLPVGNGGTGLTSYTSGALVYASGTSTLASLTKGTSGQVLTTNSSGNPAWATLPTSGLTGTVTTNYLVKGLNNNTTLQNSGIYEISNKVGIGTTAPNTKLHVVGGLIVGDATGNWATANGAAAFGQSITNVAYNAVAIGNGFSNTVDNSLSVGVGFQNILFNPIGNCFISPAANQNTHLLVGQLPQNGDPLLGLGYKLMVNGNAYAYGGSWAGSDVRWKKNIAPLKSSLEKVCQLQGVNYEWRLDEFPDKGFMPGTQVGLIAQDAEKAVPELVSTDNKGYKAFAYDRLPAYLVEAIKELKAENDSLKAANQALGARLKAIEDRLAK